MLRRRREYDRVLGDYSKAARRKPFDVEMLNDLAWMLSACPDDRFRDGEQAIAHATKACELSENRDWNSLDILAAAYAEAGRFEDAQKTASQTLDSRDTEVSRRLQAYWSRQPYREG